MKTLRVGLVGAGPWATDAMGPMLTAGRETRLEGIWARRPEAAAVLAGQLGVAVFPDYEALLAACDAVVFAVPPAVQAGMALTAARAGKAVLLQKPLAEDLGAARRLAAAIAAAGVGSLVALTFRFGAPVRRFLERARGLELLGGRARFLTGALLQDRLATDWRAERGMLLDLGPHVLDLLEAALGPVARVHAYGQPSRWLELVLEHEPGAVSQASLSGAVAVGHNRTDIEVYGPTGWLSVDIHRGAFPAAFDRLRREFAEVARCRGGHPLDVDHGVHLQELIARVRLARPAGTAGRQSGAEG